MLSFLTPADALNKHWHMLNTNIFLSFGQVNLAMEMKDQGVIGIDLCGNPVVGEW
jgi:hypothetical protein